MTSTSSAYHVGAISALFSSTSLPDASTGNLSSLFSDQNKEKFKRAIKPKEFEQKKKIIFDEKGNRKDPKKKKPKHPKKASGDNEGLFSSDEQKR